MKNKIEILQERISEDHNDSIWYDGVIAITIKPNGTELLLIATGEIRIMSKDGNLVFDGDKERNEGIEGGLNSDKDLKKLGYENNEKYSWVNNNWFEVIFKKKGEKCFDSIMGDVAYEYDQAIGLLKGYLVDDNY